MSLRWATKDDFSIALPDRPGELASLTGKLADADIILLGLWGIHSLHGEENIHCVPENPKQFRQFAETEGLKFEEGMTIYLNGPDSGGALVETLEEIATAGVNLHAVQAVAVHGNFGCFIWADQKDWEVLAKTLG